MTTLVRWEPFREIASVQSELSRLMNGLFEGAPRPTQAWVPTVDVWETETALHYAFDLPGIPKDQIAIEVEDNALTVTATRERDFEVEGDGLARFERRYGTFSRTVGLPQGVSEDAIKASYEHGVLEVTVPKPEQAKPKRIEISVEGEQPTIEG